MRQPYYLTTTLPYVNAAPHIGFALELVQADALVRAKRLLGHETVFNMGSDEHGVKILRAAEHAGVTPQAYVDEYAAKFQALRAALDVSWDRFVRTTDDYHVRAAQAFWERCAAAGDIYKQTYKVKYCSGCELEKTDSELVDGKCPLHPTTPIEEIEEENFFFRFSRYQQSLLDLYDARPDFVMPASRLGEIRSFVASGLKDFSISRRADKMPWGVPVPNDPDHVMYVWFDALVNYVSTIGWPEEGKEYDRFWPGVQVAGKDNLRQQAAMWQAMLFSAGLPNTRQIFIHGFIMGEGGVKMSKSLGNVIDPYEAVTRYGTDAVRWFLLNEIHATEDSEFSWARFESAYGSHLANGLGNFVARSLAMATKAGVRLGVRPDVEAFWRDDSRAHELSALLGQYGFNEAMDRIWDEIRAGDRFINETEPYRTIKTDPDKAKRDLEDLLGRLLAIGSMLAPFMPNTSAAILGALQEGVALPAPLFPRIESAAPADAPEAQEAPRPVSLHVAPELAARGIKVRVASLTVPAVKHRQGASLKAHIESVVARLDIPALLARPLLQEYRSLYAGSALEGAVPPAEHLLRLVQQTGRLPNINNVVDAYNAVSVETGLSIGAHDLDAIKGGLRFVTTDGTEPYTPLGQAEQVRVTPGEYACMDDEKIICRMDVKQCEETKIAEGVTSFAIYVQGNRASTDEEVLAALQAVCDNVREHCGGAYSIQA